MDYLQTFEEYCTTVLESNIPLKPAQMSDAEWEVKKPRELRDKILNVKAELSMQVLRIINISKEDTTELSKKLDEIKKIKLEEFKNIYS